MKVRCKKGKRTFGHGDNAIIFPDDKAFVEVPDSLKFQFRRKAEYEIQVEKPKKKVSKKGGKKQ